jgi:hypothetical protein
MADAQNVEEDFFPEGSVQKAMLELVMDRFTADDDDSEGAFNCVPMRLGNNLVLVSFIVGRPVTHITPDGMTEIPAMSGITFIVQEYLVGPTEENQIVDPNDAAVPLWPLKNVLEG